MLEACRGDKKLKNFFKRALEKEWQRSPTLQVVLKRCRVELPKYRKDGSLAKVPQVWFKCEKCDHLCKSGLTKKAADVKGVRRIQIDHIDPTMPLDGREISWGEFIYRLRVPPEEAHRLQALCDVCHSAKSLEENTTRREAKKGEK
jgi:hypothetical protein